MYVCMYVCMYAMLCFAVFIPTSSISYAPIIMLLKHARNSLTTVWFDIPYYLWPFRVVMYATL